MITDTAITGSMYEAMLVAEPTKLSVVAVNAKGKDYVEDGSVTDITVTYTAKDTIYNAEEDTNMISIDLPALWEPAYRPQGSEAGDFAGFGNVVETSIPRSGRANTSYVVFKATLKSKDELTPAVNFSGISVDVMEMKANDTIIVTFHNVKVIEDVGSEAQPAYLYVADSIVGSEYDVSVNVNPLKLGTVAVTPDPVTAGDMVDLNVKYTAATKALSFGRIQVTLPTLDHIYEERQTDPDADPDATYVTVDSSRSVELAENVNGDPSYLSVNNNNHCDY